MRWIVPLAVWVWWSCQPPLRHSTDFPKQAVLNESPSISNSDIESFVRFHPWTYRYRTDLIRFYSSREGKPVWVDSAGFTPFAIALIDWWNETALTDFPWKSVEDSIRNLYSPLFLIGVRPYYEDELMFTSLYFNRAQQAFAGSTEYVAPRLNGIIPNDSYDVSQRLAKHVRGMPSPQSFYPVHPQYEQLVEKVRQLKSLEKSYPYGLVNPDHLPLKQGDTSKVLPILQKRLELLGDLTGAYRRGELDAATVSALKSFQRRMGFQETGIIDSLTLVELNVPIDKRIEQVLLNMERLRWMPFDSSSRFLVVNIPAAELTFFEKEHDPWTCHVVVGKSTWPTAVFRTKIIGLEFNPYWNVPSKILKEELLPELIRDPTWLIKEHYEVINTQGETVMNPENVDWSDPYRIAGLRIRQLPGPWNALGKVRFDSYNPFGIYLHDTPSKRFFKSPDRALSHGCVRVEDPYRLLWVLIQELPQVDRAIVANHWRSDKTAYVKLRKPVPVYLVYFTSWVDSGGDLCFRRDIYGYDARLAAFLRGIGPEMTLSQSP